MTRPPPPSDAKAPWEHVRAHTSPLDPTCYPVAISAASPYSSSAGGVYAVLGTGARVPVVVWAICYHVFDNRQALHGYVLLEGKLVCAQSLETFTRYTW